MDAPDIPHAAAVYRVEVRVGGAGVERGQSGPVMLGDESASGHSQRELSGARAPRTGLFDRDRAALRWIIQRSSRHWFWRCRWLLVTAFLVPLPLDRCVIVLSIVPLFVPF